MSTARAQRKFIIKEDAKHVLEELWGYHPEDIFYKIFERETKCRGVYDILVLSAEDILHLFHASRDEADKISTLRFYLKNLLDQGWFPDDNSFRFTSVSFEEHETFRVNFCANSIAVRVNASDLLSYMTSARIDCWKHPNEAFAMYWQDQMQWCESLVDDKNYFYDNQKKILLENAVALLQSL